ncbi:MAG TPA: hypothetical protein PLN91_00265, partial [Rhodanobacteraceae bacterium]|nr:hypothetical protein [Rhodanobacteraceae bacterium]
MTIAPDIETATRQRHRRDQARTLASGLALALFVLPLLVMGLANVSQAPRGGFASALFMLAVVGAFSWPLWLWLFVAEAITLLWCRPRQDGRCSIDAAGHRRRHLLAYVAT